MSFNQHKYINKYNKTTYKMVPLRIRKDNSKVIDKLNSVGSVNRYLTRLIEEDIEPGILTLKQIKEKLLPILHSHKIYEIYLFGSYSRGEATRDSDIDIYCESGDIRTLYDQVDLEDEIREKLGKKVDIVFIGSIMHEYFKEQLDKDKIKLC